MQLRIHQAEMTFFMKDPYGNIFQIVEATDWFRDEKKNTGGSYGAIIGVIRYR